MKAGTGLFGGNIFKSIMSSYLIICGIILLGTMAGYFYNYKVIGNNIESIAEQRAEITAANAATLSGKLSQLANGAIYDDDGSVNAFHERKLDALEDLIESANGKPVLVAYWFKHDLKRITERLTALKVNFQRLDSDESIRKWNAGELQVGLIHPASGSESWRR